MARVLLAEDDDDHLFFTVRAFSEAGGVAVQVHAVRDGEQALSYLRTAATDPEQRPHLVVLDLKMPRVSGLEVLATMKEDPALRDIPVVILSSSDREQDVDGSYARGANSYVGKPLTAGRMRESMLDLARYWLDTAILPQGRV